MEINSVEGASIILALESQIELLEGEQANSIWNSGAQKNLKDIVNASKSALQKMIYGTGIEPGLPPYVEGMENEFINKPKAQA